MSVDVGRSVAGHAETRPARGCVLSVCLSSCLCVRVSVCRPIPQCGRLSVSLGVPPPVPLVSNRWSPWCLHALQSVYSGEERGRRARLASPPIGLRAVRAATSAALGRGARSSSSRSAALGVHAHAPTASGIAAGDTPAERKALPAPGVRGVGWEQWVSWVRRGHAHDMT